MTTDTKGESIFNALKDYFIDKAIPLTNIILATTDGASAGFEHYRGIISNLEQRVHGLFAVLCAIQRQNLVAKNLSGRLHQSLQFIINAENQIRSNSLNSRLFAQLREENDEYFRRLLLYTEVRWLLKGFMFDKVLRGKKVLEILV